MPKKTQPTPAPPVNSDNKPRRNYAVELYPDRIEHMDMLMYLEAHTYQFQIVYILHDKDVWDEEGIAKLSKRKEKGEYTRELPAVGDPKESHYHVAIHCKNPFTPTAFLKFFHVWINYSEPLSSIDSYILYMLHDTPSSMHKHQYSAEELKGDKKLIRSAVQNAHFVQLADIINVVEATDGSIKEILKFCINSDDESYIDVIKSYQSLICTMSNQQFKYHVL